MKQNIVCAFVSVFLHIFKTSLWIMEENLHIYDFKHVATVEQSNASGLQLARCRNDGARKIHIGTGLQ